MYVRFVEPRASTSGVTVMETGAGFELVVVA
jgi:hypothetical protein